VDAEEHLRGKSPQVRATYDKLIGVLRELGDITLNPVKTSIQVRRDATFLSIKPKKDHIEMEFQLGREVDEFPIYKAIRVSGNRVVHFAVLEGPDEVDDRLIGWLRESYDLVE
jgi:hypothetical protein